MSSGTWTGVGTSPEVASHSQSHPRYLRINFNESMNNDSYLVDIANYTISGLTTVSVTRIDVDTVDIVFDGPIPYGSNTIDIIGPRDLALNAMNGSYVFDAIENFRIRDIKQFGDRSFIATFSRAPHCTDLSIASVKTIGNWSVELNGKKIQVTEIEKYSIAEDDCFLIHVANVVYNSEEYDIVASNQILDEDLLDSLTNLTHTSVGHVSVPSEQFHIVSKNRSLGVPQKNTGRFSSRLIRRPGVGYLLRQNDTTITRAVVRSIFSSFYYHLDKRLLLGLKVKGPSSVKLESIRASIIKIAKMNKEVVDATCSLQYVQKYQMLEIALTLYTRTGQSVVGLSLGSDGGITYA